MTIVVPLYNYERFVAGCLESVLAQDYRPLEILVVDDGSQDGGAAVARRYERETPDESVRVIAQENRTTPGAVNRGIEEARGAYVAWLSADDLFLPHKISRQMEAFRRDPGLDCVFSNLRWRADVPQALAWCPLPREEARARLRRDGVVEWDTAYPPAPSEAVLGLLFTTQVLLYLGTSLIPRRVFDEVGLLDATYRRSHDYELAMRMAAAGMRFALTPEPLVICRAHAGNTRYWGEICDDENRVRRKFLAEHPLEAFYPRLAEAGTEERARILAEHVRRLIHYGMLDEALAAWETHVREAAPGPAALELGKAWMGAGRVEPARVELEKAVRWDARCTMAHYLLGDAYRAQGRLGPALRAYCAGLRRAVGR